jgi:hypothetical protein
VYNHVCLFFATGKEEEKTEKRKKLFHAGWFKGIQFRDYCNNSQGLMPVCFLKAAEKWEMEE